MAGPSRFGFPGIGPQKPPTAPPAPRRPSGTELPASDLPAADQEALKELTDVFLDLYHKLDAQELPTEPFHTIFLMLVSAHKRIYDGQEMNRRLTARVVKLEKVKKPKKKKHAR